MQVLPNETPDGSGLCEEVTYPHGGFLYQMEAGEPPAFFALKAPTAEQFEAFQAAQARRSMT